MNQNVFKSFPELSTERLELKELVNPNLDHLLEITSFNGRANNHKEVVELVKNVTDGFSKKRMITWGIYKGPELIGTIGYYRGFENDIGEVGYVTREPFRRKGYMWEALIRVLNFGFKDLDLKMITAYTTDSNEASIGVIYKMGFTRTEEMSGDHRRYELPREKAVL
ncbi:MAG: hypothetical protein CL840_16845 [Crocinitomicaceae bacterium]|nr:hypothetical protein [Crocinitomicaceae bacterium]|tara:strand:+ start:3374 stop:3874 length:501 start_codon:yes stop_codon:yes gene_type:complete